ncbi:hypothetical protein AKJ59_00675 [candidate division MSBL1 archaeon SCGC-AAA385M02]|uniref:Uncharacterized protein n=1 Tax=candidate division MSBL1 archaeon SCGC-AAA385M02 TaxID=1698287 RepID=A0A133VQJ2_9EURY|nr:hypothetical protein AKJ59_00675 [candidate division MSBL1 archaeon SCGC-AAA385M02]
MESGLKIMLRIYAIQYAITSFYPPLSDMDKMVYWMNDKELFNIRITINGETKFFKSIKYHSSGLNGVIYPNKDIKVKDSDTFDLQGNVVVPRELELLLTPRGVRIY